MFFLRKKIVVMVFLSGLTGFCLKGFFDSVGKDVNACFEDNLAKVYVTGFANSDPDQLNCFGREFSYLGNGCQSVAFESVDKRFVLKFFTLKPFYEGLRLKNYKSGFFSEWKKGFKRKKRLEKVLENYNVIFEKKPDLAGLLFVHLNQKKEVLPEALLHWPDGSCSRVFLSDYFFVLQKKADLVFDAVEGSQDLQGKIERIDSMRSFLIERVRLGFRDKRKTMSMHMNYGFFGKEPLHFDVGNVVFDPEVLKNPEDEIQSVLGLFDGWVRENKDGLGL